MKREGAYTLLEVLMIITLISILLTISYPQFRGLINHAGIESVTRELVLTLRQTQQMALNNYSRYYFEIVDDKQIVVYEEGSGTYVKELTFTDEVKITGNRISFGPLGTAYRRTFNINYADRSTKVIVAPSGRIRRE